MLPISKDMRSSPTSSGRHETLARIGQLNRHWSSVEIEHGRRIKRVAVHPNDDLGVDRRQFTMMLELAESAFFQRHGAEVQTRLGTDEVLDGDGHRVARLLLRRKTEVEPR